MENIIGIDLGTTNTCVAHVKKTGGKTDFEIIENSIGEKITPSIVSFDEDNILVGKPAKNKQIDNSKNTIYGIKRLFGHSIHDSDVEKLFKNAPFELTEDKQNHPQIKIVEKGEEKLYLPEQISAIVLGEVSDFVKKKTLQPPSHCVITVPAYFNNLQREATKIAAEIAGLNVIQLLNEPVAAAIAFQRQVNFKDGIVLVYDFGGGTLDVSILEVHGNRFDVRAVSGDTAFGGEDIDAILVEEMANRFKKKTGKDPRTNSSVISRLKIECEQLKKTLSARPMAEIHISNLMDGLDLDEKITRSKFEDLCDDLFSKLTDTIDEALEESGLTIDDIDHLILVGGSSAIPKVAETIEEFFEGRLKPLNAVNPDEAIAMGAAIYCKQLVQKMKVDDDECNEIQVVDDEEEAPKASTKPAPAPKSSTKPAPAPAPKSSTKPAPAPAPKTSTKPVSAPAPTTAPAISITSEDISDEESESDDIEIVDVQSTSIGIRNGKHGFKKYIERNKPLPQENTFTFTTSRDNAKSAKIRIFMGEEDEIGEGTHILLDEYSFKDLPPRPKGVVLLQVTLKCNVEGLLSISASCSVQGEDLPPRSLNASIDTKKAISSEDKQKLIQVQKELMERKEIKELLGSFKSQIISLDNKDIENSRFKSELKRLESAPTNTQSYRLQIISELKRNIENARIAGK